MHRKSRFRVRHFFQKQWFRRLFLFCFQGLRLFLLPTMVIISVLADGKEPWANIPLPVKSVNGFQGFEKSFLSDFLCQHTVTAQPPDIEQHIPENARYTWSKSMFFPPFTQFTRQNEKRYSTLQIFTHKKSRKFRGIFIRKQRKLKSLSYRRFQLSYFY